MKSLGNSASPQEPPTPDSNAGTCCTCCRSPVWVFGHARHSSLSCQGLQGLAGGVCTIALARLAGRPAANPDVAHSACLFSWS